MKNICFIAGTRPEIIKMAPVIIEFNQRGNAKFNTTFLATGQHKQMAEQAMSIFELSPDYDMEIMAPNQSLNNISAKIFSDLPGYFDMIQPDIIFIQGDTTTVAMAGLAAFNAGIPVAHIEAGLRTYDLKAPFPEELNRRIVSVFSKFNFAPTENAKNNLISEKCDPTTIYVTGNTVVDALHIIRNRFDLKRIFQKSFGFYKPFILLTAHRRESFGSGFENICKAISQIANNHPELDIVYPVHLNPNVRQPVMKFLSNVPNVKLLEPVPYIELLALLSNSVLCITDSGGIQEEAPSFGKYTIVLRDFTERMESVYQNKSRLVGTSVDKIVSSVEELIGSPSLKEPFSDNPYGDGKASMRIFDTIDKYFS